MSDQWCPLPLGSTAICLYPFTANHPECLTAEVGDILLTLETFGDEWVRAIKIESRSFSIGIIPVSFIAPLKEPTNAWEVECQRNVELEQWINRIPFSLFNIVKYHLHF